MSSKGTSGLGDPMPPWRGKLIFQCGDCGEHLGKVTVPDAYGRRRRMVYGRFWAEIEHDCPSPALFLGHIPPEEN